MVAFGAGYFGLGLVCAGKGFFAGVRYDCGAAGEDVEERRRGWRRCEARGFEDGFEFAGADHGVHFRNAFADFVAIALHQAAGDDEFFGRAGGFVAGHFEDGIDRLLLGCVDEAACVDDEDFGLFGMRGQPRAGVIEQAHHHLGIDEVFWTA
jgi:hypothetical protein